MTLHADHCTHRPGPVQPSSENISLPLNESQPRHAQRDAVQKARDSQHSVLKGHLHQSPPSRRRVCAERRWEIFRGTGDGWFQSTVFQTQGNRHTNMLTEVWQAHETCRLQTVSRGVDIWSHLPPRGYLQLIPAAAGNALSPYWSCTPESRSAHTNQAPSISVWRRGS